MPIATQYGDLVRADAQKARAALGAILGPIPRYLYGTLDDNQLAEEISARYTARRMEMSTRIVMDQTLLRYMDPEKIQDHWRNFWTGETSRKLQHSSNLATGIINYPRAIIEALTALLTGGKPMAYTIDVMPWFKEDPAAKTGADIVEQFLARWRSENEYERTFTDLGSNVYALGRNWSQVTMSGADRFPRAENLWPGSVAAFWQHDKRTLECVITSSEMLPGEAVAMFPKKEKEIAAAIQAPSNWTGFGQEKPYTSWDLNSTVTVLTCWYRSDGKTIGQANVLQSSANKNNGRSVLLSHTRTTKYPDLPLRCTPRFKTNDRPPDEAQGVLFDIAPIATQLDEVVFAARDMLWRAIYARYKLSNAYGKPPGLIPGTSILALRAGQDLTRLEDVINNVPVDTFIARFEKYLLLLPGLSEYFVGQALPAETSGEAINAAVNASITRQESTRTEVGTDERWKCRMVVGLSAAYMRWGDISMAPVLDGDYDYQLTWQSDNPREAIKAKQLAMAALKAGIISLDTAQSTFGITNTQDEQRKILKERTDPRWRPDVVQMTAQAMLAMRALTQPPVQPALPAGAASKDGGAPAGQARASSDTMAANMTPPQYENDNERVAAPSMAGEAGR